MASFPVSINTRIHNKPPQWLEEFADNWQQQDCTLELLREWIGRGYAFIPVAMNSEHRSSEAFMHADLAVVDIDGGLTLEAFAQQPLAASALFLYTTPSHRPETHRFRVVFRLPQRVSDPATYKAIVTLLIRQLGGDKSCTDPCRLFYGCSHGKQQLLAPDSSLPESILAEAAQLLEEERIRFERASEGFDELDILQAEFVLDQVLEPTADGERDLFIRITAAAASAGSSLYASWSDWASRGHHGKGKNARQTSERFFQGFSGRSSLATLFFLAGEQDPEWRRRLPEELRKSDHAGGPGPGLDVVGYGHSDFLGSEEDLELQAAAPTAPAALATPSIFEADPSAWPRPPAPEGAGTIPEVEPPDDSSGGDPPIDPPTGKRGRPKKQKPPGGQIAQIKSLVNTLYPDLRLNTLNLHLEYGPRQSPELLTNPEHTYLLISLGKEDPFPKTATTDTVALIAWKRRYNPVTAYLEHCRQNAEPIDYLDSVATTLLGVPPEGPDNPRMPSGELFADLMMRRFLIGAVARALNPGCTHSWMPILIGSQNVGKTNFFRYLTPPHPLSGDYPWAATVQQGISYLKEKPHALHAGWIVLFDEVERYFRRRYTEELKNLISVPTDVSARKWENERQFPRNFVLAGATNTDTFMVDPTGNRRFMPLRVLGRVPSPEDPSIRIVDLDRLKRDRDRIWAAAHQAYLDSPVHEFSSYELNFLTAYNSGFEVDSPLTEAIRRVLDRGCTFLFEGKPAYTTAYLFEQLDVRLDAGTSLSKAVSDEMTRMGYENIQRRVNGRARRFWRPTDKVEQPGGRKPWE